MSKDHQNYVDKYAAALELFSGDHDAARKWLRTPCKALGYRKPIDDSVENVRDLVGRMAHGVTT